MMARPSNAALTEAALIVLSRATAEGDAKAAARLLDAMDAQRARDATEARRAAFLGDDPIAIAREAGLSDLTEGELRTMLGRKASAEEARVFERHRIVARATS